MTQDLAAANGVVADASVDMGKIGDTHIPQITEAVQQGVASSRSLPA